MKKDINEIMINLKKVANQEYYVEDLFCYEECQTLYDFIVDLQKEFNKLNITLNKINQLIEDEQNNLLFINDYNINHKSNMIKFWLDGCDISFLAIAPEDITLKQLLKQCNRIKPEWCTCGINSKNIEDYHKVEIIIDYNDVKKVDDTVSCDILENKK